MANCYAIVDRQLRKNLAAEFDMTLVRFDILATLDRHPDGLSMSDLSAELFVTAGNISGIVRDLKEQKLVTTSTAQTDRRSSIVSLTDSGRACAAKLNAAHQAWVEDLLGGMSQSQSMQLMELLGAVRKQLAARGLS
ncbi:MarR family winged helix-turn-helix transcriptional regulator [Alsobacter sp. SYSU M60028]|uniref:MarR family winged helix-turn-helix transcriptional regulator n=1 Tax=Alsobacter ponti TaxID=2962936 RepID=A0ABT1LEX2_9HYPH|nr:MarR family winged helix-turn-helix transcriptional regulator [Alsobacter ponti]MCP8939984.1 MarR family winged helix-turn-helix transcriptional regulator [Alsobacter ponti]